MSIDIRQSPQYAKYIESIGWQVKKLGKWNVIIKKFPLIGSLIKIQRIDPPIPFEEIENLAKKYRAFQIIIEPSFVPQNLYTPQIPKGYKPLKSPFIPTKTLILDLKRTEKEIFASFSKNKRRDVRIAKRNKLIIKEGTPQQFYELKKKFLLRKKILPFGMKKEIFPLCETFGKNANILLVYSPNTPARHASQACEGVAGRPNTPKNPNSPLAGILLLFHNKTAYYWQAASTEKGKKLLAPTILLWKAIKLAKKKGCTKFDFEGIYDERFPKNKSWLGFTHFKQGFGGKEVKFPLPLSSLKFPLNIL